LNGAADRDDVGISKRRRVPGECPAANRRLQIETDERDLPGDGSAMRYQPVIVRFA
jgi:hypothetical protein